MAELYKGCLFTKTRIGRDAERKHSMTIHQSIPINGIASLSLSIQILAATGDVSEMIQEMEKKNGVHSVKVLARE